MIEFGGIPAFWLAGVLALGIQWLMFVPAYMRQTERFFDLTGSITFLVLVAFGAWVGGDSRSILLAVLIALWAVRLGSFLYFRVHSEGGDRRFDRIKRDFFQFLLTWTLQGVWVFVTLAPALVVMTNGVSEPLGGWAIAGTTIWLAGFVLEVVADAQKRAFRADPENGDRFIDRGLWAWSQHPNYFGEILLWCGVTVIAVPELSGWQWLVLLSPVFVFLLLTRISGVRMLDARARRRWGEDPDFQAYRAATPVLFPRPPRRKRRAAES